MGRPINYKKIGGDTANTGNQLLFQAWFTGEDDAENAFLVKQVSETRFKVAAVADPSRVEIMELVDEQDNVEGTCYMTIRAFGNVSFEGVRKITQHRVYTFEGNAYKYYVDPAASVTGEVDLPVA
jgi:hypothetical protein